MGGPAWFGLGLLVIGCVLVVAWAGRVAESGKLRTLLPWLLILAGSGMVAWELVAAMAILLALIAFFIYLSIDSDKAYEREYPVFASEAIHSFTTAQGFDYHLHIARFREAFYIDVRYDTEVDMNRIAMRTKWAHRFDDYAAAERELLRRVGEMVPAADKAELPLLRHISNLE